MADLITSLTTCTSVGRVGRGQVSSPPAPMMPPRAMGKPLVTCKRMVIAAVCQPAGDDARPPNRESPGRSVVQVKGLRVELRGKTGDLRLVRPWRVFAAGELVAHGQVFQVDRGFVVVEAWLAGVCVMSMAFLVRVLGSRGRGGRPARALHGSG